MKKDFFEPKDDYRVMSLLRVQDKPIPDVPCRVYIPSIPTEKPELYFYPSLDQFKAITSDFKGEFKATILGFESQPSHEFSSECVYFEDMETKYWGKDSSESYTKGLPQNLRFTQCLQKKLPPTTKSNIVFWLTPNSYLAPAMITNTSYTGDIKHERIRIKVFDFGILNIKFDHQFFLLPSPEDENHQKSCLVGTLSHQCKAIDADLILNEIIPSIDEILLIASIACRTRTVCVGWQASDNESISNFYRGFLSTPSGNQTRTLDRGLVSAADFETFITNSFQVFQNSHYKKAIESSIHAILGIENGTIESSFLTLYAALEELLFSFRKENEYEVIFDKSNWKEFKKGLMSWIKSHPEISIPKEKRCLIYDKLNELNRISASTAFKKMCCHLEIDLNDLWPVYGNSQKATLSSIRNALTHGSFPSEYAFPYLATALDHLQWTLERILLTLLDWPIDQSEVSSLFLNRMAATSITNLTPHRDKLTTALE